MPLCWLHNLATTDFFLFAFSRFARSLLKRRDAAQENTLFTASGAEQCCGQGMERLLSPGIAVHCQKGGACVHSTGTLTDTSAALQVSRRGRQTAKRAAPMQD